MTEQTQPSVPKWPFFLGDAAMLGLAWFVYSESKLPLPNFALGAICAVVALGALLASLPFILDYHYSLRRAETESLITTVAQLKNLENIAAQINLATGHWQTVQTHSGKTVAAAKEIGDRMTTEAKAFADFMQKANDAEKGTLRLEVEKLRRAESDWVQVVVNMLDHTFALHTAAARTGKTALIEQLSQFQTALRDSARRVGLTPFTAASGDSFDAAKHQTTSSDKPGPDATIRETLAIGFTLRGQLIRPALVALASPQVEEEPAPAAAAAAPVAEEPTLL